MSYVSYKQRGNESEMAWEMKCLTKQNGPDLNCLPGNDYNNSNKISQHLFICESNEIYSSVAMKKCT